MCLLLVLVRGTWGEMQKKSKKSDKVKRASSEFSFLDKPNSKNNEWLDKMWQGLSPLQRIEAMLPYRDDHGRTVLINAVRTRDDILVNTLLARPTLDPNQQDNYGNTALHHCLMTKNVKALELLLACPHVITPIVNHSAVDVNDMIEASTGIVFSDTLRLQCFARVLVDRAVANYIDARSERVDKSQSDASLLQCLHESIRTTIQATWQLSQYRNRSFPVEVLSQDLQTQIVNLRVESHIKRPREKTVVLMTLV